MPFTTKKFTCSWEEAQQLETCFILGNLVIWASSMKWIFLQLSLMENKVDIILLYTHNMKSHGFKKVLNGKTCYFVKKVSSSVTMSLIQVDLD